MKFSNKHILWFIIFVGCVLRFYNYLNIDYQHDEFSALYRTNFDTIKELILKGAKIDGHPIGVQVFLYYWVQLVGWNPWLIKLPFTLVGIASIYYMYKIGTIWFNETVGLLCASFIASIQFVILYNTIARPYSTGLFFSLILLYFWSKIIQEGTHTKTKTFVLFAVSAALCAYNHHFSLLFAALISFAGIFFISKKQRLKYILSGGLIFLLYLPHLPIFFSQLKVGGVGINGWLGPPSPDFLKEHLRFIFQYSPYVFAVTCAIIIYGFVFSSNLKSYAKKFILFSFLFLSPIAIGYYYSIYRNPVLQNSLLLFSLPCLFLAIFAHLKAQSVRINFILILIIFIVNIHALIFIRNYYFLRAHNPYNQAVLIQEKVYKKFQKNVVIYQDVHPLFYGYYRHENAAVSPFKWFKNFKSIGEFEQDIRNEKETHTYLFYSQTSDNFEAIAHILKYFPTIKQRWCFPLGTCFLFSTQPNLNEELFDFCDFQKPLNARWKSIQKSHIKIDKLDSNNILYYQDSLTEFSIGFESKLSDLIKTANHKLAISLDFRPIKDTVDAVIVVSVVNNGKSVHWLGSNFIGSKQDKTSWNNVVSTIDLSRLYEQFPKAQIVIYVWNMKHQSFEIDNFKISNIRLNPINFGDNGEINRE